MTGLRSKLVDWWNFELDDNRKANRTPPLERGAFAGFLILSFVYLLCALFYLMNKLTQ